MSLSYPFSWLFRGRGRGSPSSASTKEGPEEKRKGKEGAGSSEEEELGVTEELREFVKGFTIDTFKRFSFPQSQDGDTASSDGSWPPKEKGQNVRKDLTEWQELHATLVLAKVKEISHLRYVLCPRHLKEDQFWRIYFLLVKSYTAPYELRSIQKQKIKMMELGDEKPIQDGAVEVEMTETKQIMREIALTVDNGS